MNITLRTTTQQDQPFLYRVYASTRLEELAPLGWSPDQLNAFLSMQFVAQDTHYRQEYKGTEFFAVMLDNMPVGRYYVYRSDSEIILMDIALLPEYRGHGIGTKLIRDLLDEAAAHKLPVRLHVEPYNRARHLYERMGFSLLEDKGVYHYMEWKSL